MPYILGQFDALVKKRNTQKTISRTFTMNIFSFQQMSFVLNSFNLHTKDTLFYFHSFLVSTLKKPNIICFSMNFQNINYVIRADTTSYLQKMHKKSQYYKT